MGEFDFRAGEVARDILTRRAKDITLSTASRTTLVIAPHPDDETFGCGATIARKRAAGTDVHICVVSDGSAFPTDEFTPAELVEMRRENLTRACAVLGVDDAEIERLDFPDGGTGDRIDEISRAVAEVIKRLEPDEIFIPSSYDAHPDHQSVYRAATKAIELAGTSAVVYAYPVWFWARETWWSHQNEGKADRVLHRLRVIVAGLRLRPVKVDASLFVESKRDAMEHYAWELKPDREYFDHWSLGPEELFFVYAPSGRRRA